MTGTSGLFRVKFAAEPPARFKLVCGMTTSLAIEAAADRFEVWSDRRGANNPAGCSSSSRFVSQGIHQGVDASAWERFGRNAASASRMQRSSHPQVLLHSPHLPAFPAESPEILPRPTAPTLPTGLRV